MGDPNWLYSSIVQSSAALVAILGGFITASILNRISTRDDLQSQLDILHRRRKLAEKQRADREREWSLARIEDALDDAADHIYEDQHQSLSFREARPVIGLPDDIPDDLFEREWEAYKDEITQWAERIKRMDSESLPGPFEPFGDWVERNHIDVAGRSWTLLETIVVRLQSLLQQKRQHTKE